MNKSTIKPYNLVLISLFTATIAVCSLVSVPFTVPFTLQVFGVFLAVFTLGYKKSVASVMVYIMLGLVGLPIFSSFQGGLQVLFSVNGGFIIGFVVMTIVTGLLLNKAEFNLKKMLICGFLGLISLYFCQFSWLICVYSFKPIAALLLIIIYFPLDIIKMFLAAILSLKLRKVIKINEFA